MLESDAQNNLFEYQLTRCEYQTDITLEDNLQTNFSFKDREINANFYSLDRTLKNIKGKTNFGISTSNLHVGRNLADHMTWNFQYLKMRTSVCMNFFT